MVDSLILTVTGQDGHIRQITLSPVLNDNEHNNVYSVYEGETWGGDFAFDEDHTKWEYIGELPYDEQLQIVEALYYHLQSPEGGFPSDMIVDTNEAEFPIPHIADTIKFTAYHEGVMSEFEIVPNEGSFGVLMDGKLAAEVELDEDGLTWIVSNGELDDDVLVQDIGRKIEDKYR
ncbi:hypothetical protein GCM10023149_54030 [Mucilaginibacter gynuensis]|uniref:DUF4367 domain-containing protein n=1 Tax=Mucilaginibacter gynuensis TaxID=1302236 RepID=A0ABP8HNK2_9SPHI